MAGCPHPQKYPEGLYLQSAREKLTSQGVVGPLPLENDVRTHPPHPQHTAGTTIWHFHPNREQFHLKLLTFNGKGHFGQDDVNAPFFFFEVFLQQTKLFSSP